MFETLQHVMYLTSYDAMVAAGSEDVSRNTRLLLSSKKLFCHVPAITNINEKPFYGNSLLRNQWQLTAVQYTQQQCLKCMAMFSLT